MYVVDDYGATDPVILSVTPPIDIVNINIIGMDTGKTITQIMDGTDAFVAVLNFDKQQVSVH